MIKSIEDCLELLVGLQDDPNNEFKVNEVDGTILSSIGRQVCRGVPLTDRQLEVVKNKLSTTYRLQFKNYKEFDKCLGILRMPLREIDRSHYVKVIKEKDESLIAIRFPFSKKLISAIEKNCKECGDFLDQLVLLSGTKGDEKYHVASYVKQFFNSEIKAARAIGDVSKTFASLYNFYYDKTTALLDKIKTPKTRAQKSKLVHDSQNYLRENEGKFKAMINLYKKIQESKQFIIDKLDDLETFRTFALTDNGYKVTGPEGYVLHKDGDMVKLVNRLEFSYINFTLAKKWR